MLAYSNPVVVIESFALFFLFVYREFHNKTINTIAGSTFAVYIIQVTSPVKDWLFSVDKWALGTMPYAKYILMMLAFAFCFFFVCVGYDRLRVTLLGRLLSKAGERINMEFMKALYAFDV